MRARTWSFVVEQHFREPKSRKRLASRGLPTTVLVKQIFFYSQIFILPHSSSLKWEEIILTVKNSCQQISYLELKTFIFSGKNKGKYLFLDQRIFFQQILNSLTLWRVKTSDKQDLFHHPSPFFFCNSLYQEVG